MATLRFAFVDSVELSTARNTMNGWGNNWQHVKNLYPYNTEDLYASFTIEKLAFMSKDSLLALYEALGQDLRRRRHQPPARAEKLEETRSNIRELLASLRN